MKGTSKLIMGATLVMSVSLVLVLGLVIVLLAELYCSFLLRRRQLRHTTSTSSAAATDATAANPTAQQSRGHHEYSASGTAPPSLSSFYAQGVLRAPRSILFPAVSDKSEVLMDVEKQHSVPAVLQLGPKSSQNPKSLADLVSVSISHPPSPTFTPLATSPKPDGGTSNYSGTHGSGREQELVYISNPIYDGAVGLRPSSWVDNTPFETPDSSPSRLETGDPSSSSSCNDDDDDELEKAVGGESSRVIIITTPPLTPMKKLPAEGCSVTLRDARSLGTSGSEESNSNNCVSSSSSGTPCTSPSW